MVRWIDIWAVLHGDVEEVFAGWYLHCNVGCWIDGSGCVRARSINGLREPLLNRIEMEKYALHVQTSAGNNKAAVTGNYACWINVVSGSLDKKRRKKKKESVG